MWKILGVSSINEDDYGISSNRIANQTRFLNDVQDFRKLKESL